MNTPKVIATYPTPGGATVHALTRQPLSLHAGPRESIRCTGCGTTRSVTTGTARTAASRHARACRASSRR